MEPLTAFYINIFLEFEPHFIYSIFNRTIQKDIMGRPVKEINWDVVDKLIEAGCSGIAIAAKFRIQSDTFYSRFKQEYGCSFQDYRANAQEVGIADLMMMLHAKAMNNKAPGNTNLLIFLAKTKLGMKEPETDNSTAPNQDKIDLENLVMRLQNKIAKLESDAIQRETE